MLADAIAILVTWFNLYRGRSRGVLGGMSLGDIILRDGKFFDLNPHSARRSQSFQEQFTSCTHLRSWMCHPHPDKEGQFSTIFVLNALHLTLTLLSVCPPTHQAPPGLLTSPPYSQINEQGTNTSVVTIFLDPYAPLSPFICGHIILTVLPAG